MRVLSVEGWSYLFIVAGLAGAAAPSRCNIPIPTPGPSPTVSPTATPTPTPTPTATPTPTPTPTATPDDFPVPPLPDVSHRSINIHPQYTGADATPVVVQSPDYCQAIGYGSLNGLPRASCPLAPDGTDARHRQETLFLGGNCPMWEGSYDLQTWWRCYSRPGPALRCENPDHAEDPPAGCAPETGFYTQPIGHGWVRACALDGLVCSAPLRFDHP